MTRVLIGASSRALRAWLESSLARNATFEVVGSFSIDDALAHCEELQPDVMLLESPADESVSLAIESSDGSVDAALIILTDDTKKFLTKSALRSGVRARDGGPLVGSGRSRSGEPRRWSRHRDARASARARRR